MEGNLAIIRVGDRTLLVWLHTCDDPPQEEWDAWFERLRRLRAERGGTMNGVHALVVSDGGAPNSNQRTQLFGDLLRDTPAAVITNALGNPVKRSIAAVLGWLNPHIRVVSPEKTLEAFEHLGCIRIDEREQVLATLQELQRDLPPVRTLAQVIEALGNHRKAAART